MARRSKGKGAAPSGGRSEADGVGSTGRHRARSKYLAPAAVASVALLVAWVRSIPANPAHVDMAWLGAPAATFARADDLYTGEDGRDYVYLGGYDSHAWVSAARRLLGRGSVCDEVVDGFCRERTTLAPHDRTVGYPRSVHVWGIAALHRALSSLDPGRPLQASAFALSMLVGVFAVLPAFLIGLRLVGLFGGLVTALVASLNPLLLFRTFGADNDVWNFFFPALLVWFSTEAILSRSPARGIAFSLLAGLTIGPYAITWNGWPFAWAICLFGLLANAILLTAGELAGRRDPDTRTNSAWATAAVFFVSAGVVTHLAGATVDYFDLFSVLSNNPLIATVALAGSTVTLSWPDNFSTVGELSPTSLAQVAAWFGGLAPLFVAWLGLMLMLLPLRGWRQVHFTVFLAGVVLYRVLFAVEQQTPALMVMALALPLVAALGLYAVDSRDGARRRASISVVLWFLGGLFLGLESGRFLLLIVLPFAVAIAVAMNRLVMVVESLDLGRRMVNAAAVGLAIFVTLFMLRTSLATAQTFRPNLNRAWGDVLTQIRDHSAADATVTTWWPAGYFAHYLSERRVTADGGTLPSSRPYWLARAMMEQDERRSVGFLRFLHCGSLIRRDLGPFGRPSNDLAALGWGESETLAVIERLATLNLSQAESLLGGRGVPEEVGAKVLGATHCSVPEAYVVFSTRDRNDLSWQRTALWDLSRGSAPAGVGLGGTGWGPCEPEGEGLVCSLRWRGASALELRVDDPARSRLRGAPALGPPSSLLIAAPLGVEMRSAGPGAGRWAVLYDPARRRAAIGSTALLRSTYGQLVLLDGRYNRLFEKVGEAEVAHERVTSWRIRWELLEDLS